MARFLSLNILVFVLVCLAATTAQETETTTTSVEKSTTEVETLPLVPEPSIEPSTLPDVPAEEPKDVVAAPAPVMEEEEEVVVEDASPPKPDSEEDKTPLQQDSATLPDPLGSTTFGGDLNEAVFTTDESPEKAMEDGDLDSEDEDMDSEDEDMESEDEDLDSEDEDLESEDEDLESEDEDLESEDKDLVAEATSATDLTGDEEMVMIAETPLQKNVETPPNALGSTTFGGDLTEAVYTEEAPEKDMMDEVADSLSNPLSGKLDEELKAEEMASMKEGDDDVELEDEEDLVVEDDDVEATSVTELTEDVEPTTEAASDSVLEGAMKDITTSVTSDSVILYISSFDCDLTDINVRDTENYVTCSVAAQASKGVSTISAAFYNVPMTKRMLMHFGEQDLISGNVNSGVWQLDLKIPKAADQGVWSLGFTDQGAFYGLEITDKAGNTVDYAQQAAQESIMPLQTTLTVESYYGNTVAYPQANIQTSSGVLLYGVSCAANEATVTDESKTIICEALVIPDEAGIGKATIYLVGPTGKTVIPLVFDEYSEALLVPATNTTNAMYLLTSTLSVPTWAEAGSYILPASGAYQSRTLSSAGTVRLVNPQTLSNKPTLRVVSAADSFAPRVSSFYCNGGQEVKLDDFDPVPVSCLLTAADEYSGIAYASMHFASPSKTDAVEFSFVPDSPGLGPFPAVTVKNVREAVGAQFPPNTEPGAWTLVRAVVADNSGNYKEYTATELNNKDVQTFFLVQSSLKTFSITPRAGTPAAVAEPIPGQATSGASRSTMSMVAVAIGAVAAAVVCAMS